MESSLTFDRAVEFYDKTRGLPDDVMERVLELIRPHLKSRSCIEIGVGTGRFALPLAAAGVEIVGIDLSEPMLRRLIAQREGDRPAVVLCNALRLCFDDATFDTGLACHVFHLIPEWKQALAEHLRVVRPGGVIAHDYGDFGHYEWRELMSEFLATAGLPEKHRGANEAEEVDDAARTLGAEVEVLEPIHGVRRISLARSIKGLERGTFSITWGADDVTRKRAADHVRAWAQERFGDLEVEREIPFVVRWRLYRLPIRVSGPPPAPSYMPATSRQDRDRRLR